MQWRNKVRLSAALWLVAATAVANVGPGAAADDAAPVVQLAVGNPAMHDAEAAARRHLGQFFDHVLSAEGASSEGAAVKVAIPTGGGHAEVIWVTPFARLSGDRFLGTLANAPVEIEGARAGDTIAFGEGQVRDWSFIGADRRLYGSFTTRVLLPHIPKAEAAHIASLLSELPTPADW